MKIILSESEKTRCNFFYHFFLFFFLLELVISAQRMVENTAKVIARITRPANKPIVPFIWIFDDNSVSDFPFSLISKKPHRNSPWPGSPMNPMKNISNVEFPADLQKLERFFLVRNLSPMAHHALMALLIFVSRFVVIFVFLRAFFHQKFCFFFHTNRPKCFFSRVYREILFFVFR